MENDSRLLENKITSFDHADIYGSYTTEADFGKGFASSKAREKCN
jgi:predicted oxidoreductase